jgi:hypothetical protein
VLLKIWVLLEETSACQHCLKADSTGRTGYAILAFHLVSNFLWVFEEFNRLSMGGRVSTSIIRLYPVPRRGFNHQKRFRLNTLPAVSRESSLYGCLKLDLFSNDSRTNNPSLKPTLTENKIENSTLPETDHSVRVWIASKTRVVPK